MHQYILRSIQSSIIIVDIIAVAYDITVVCYIVAYNYRYVQYIHKITHMEIV